MNIEEKAKEYDKIVELINKHSIESDGIFAKEYCKSAVLEDILERYLDTIERFKKSNNEKNDFLEQLGIVSGGEFRRIKYYIDKYVEKINNLTEELNQYKIKSENKNEETKTEPDCDNSVKRVKKTIYLLTFSANNHTKFGNCEYYSIGDKPFNAEECIKYCKEKLGFDSMTILFLKEIDVKWIELPKERKE